MVEVRLTTQRRYTSNMANKTPAIDLHAVVYREGSQWAARCLEVDLVQCARTPQAAIKDLIGAVETHIQYGAKVGDIAKAFRPADEQYWHMYFRGAASRRKIKP